MMDKTMRYYELRNRKTGEEFTAYGFTFKEACTNAQHNYRDVHLVYSTPVLDSYED